MEIIRRLCTVTCGPTAHHSHWLRPLCKASAQDEMIRKETGLKHRELQKPILEKDQQRCFYLLYCPLLTRQQKALGVLSLPIKGICCDYPVLCRPTLYLLCTKQLTQQNERRASGRKHWMAGCLKHTGVRILAPHCTLMSLNHPGLTLEPVPSWHHVWHHFCWHGDRPLLERGLEPTLA